MRKAFVSVGAMTAIAAIAIPMTAHAQSPTVLAWGTMFNVPNVATYRTPTAITLPEQVVQVGTSNSTEYALLTDGTVWAWGLGSMGQLGNGTSAVVATTPVQVAFPAGVTIASLATDAMPYNAALAIDTNGNVWGWGNNRTGALCQGGTNPQQYTTPVELPLHNVTLVAGASGHDLFDSNGSVYACGLFQNGSLGNGKTGLSFTPTAVTGMQNQNVVALVASSVDSGALLANGSYYDWGANAEDQLGVGPTPSQSNVPLLVPLRARVVQVAAGGDNTGNGSTIVRLSDGSYWGWGADSLGQLGDAGTANRAIPVQIFPPAGITYSLLGVAGATSYGVTPTGAVYAWGQGSHYGIGTGSTANAASPVEVVKAGVTQISTTAQDVLVLG